MVALKDERGECAQQGQSALERVQCVHARIVDRLAELEEATNPERVRETLNALADLLPQHFADEEGVGGLYEEIRLKRPELYPKLKSIQQEHRLILRELKWLESMVGGVGQDIGEIEKRKAIFVRRLRTHERNENLFVLDAYLEDEGGSG